MFGICGRVGGAVERFNALLLLTVFSVIDGIARPTASEVYTGDQSIRLICWATPVDGSSFAPKS